MVARECGAGRHVEALEVAVELVEHVRQREVAGTLRTADVVVSDAPDAPPGMSSGPWIFLAYVVLDSFPPALFSHP